VVVRRQQRRAQLLMVHDYPPLTGGGLALGALELVRLVQDERRCLVLSSRLVDHFADDRARLAPPCAPAAPGRLARALRDADALVVHWTFSFRRLATACLLAGPALGIPTVCVIHTAPDHCDYNRLRRVPPGGRQVLVSLVRTALRRCKVVALSRAHAAALEPAGIAVQEILPLPVSCASLCADVYAQRERNRPLETAGIVGELSTLKGADVIPGLLRALTPQFAVRIVGRGPLAPAVEEAVLSLSPEQRQRVVVADRVEPAAVPRLLAGLDGLLVLSRSESQCRLALEAMLAGVAVVARPTGGILDLVRPGATGLFVNPDDPGAVRAALARLAADPEEAAAIRARARETAVIIADRSRREWRRFLLSLDGAQGGSR
jgi:glycosyltransferase involved in cell wall biosynthesis